MQGWVSAGVGECRGGSAGVGEWGGGGGGVPDRSVGVTS